MSWVWCVGTGFDGDVRIGLGWVLRLIRNVKVDPVLALVSEARIEPVDWEELSDQEGFSFN